MVTRLAEVQREAPTDAAESGRGLGLLSGAQSCFEAGFRAWTLGLAASGGSEHDAPTLGTTRSSLADLEFVGQVLWTMVAMGTSCVCGCSTGRPTSIHGC